MRVLLVEPGKEPRVCELPDTLKAMQKAVGGAIQAVYPFAEPVALICNDEGKLAGLPLNRALYHPDEGIIYDVIAGSFFLCAAPPDSGRFAGLTEEQAARYGAYFRLPSLAAL